MQNVQFTRSSPFIDQGQMEYKIGANNLAKSYIHFNHSLNVQNNIKKRTPASSFFYSNQSTKNQMFLRQEKQLKQNDSISEQKNQRFKNYQYNSTEYFNDCNKQQNSNQMQNLYENRSRVKKLEIQGKPPIYENMNIKSDRGIKQFTHNQIVQQIKVKPVNITDLGTNASSINANFQFQNRTELGQTQHKLNNPKRLLFSANLGKVDNSRPKTGKLNKLMLNERSQYLNSCQSQDMAAQLRNQSKEKATNNKITNDGNSNIFNSTKKDGFFSLTSALNNQTNQNQFQNIRISDENTLFRKNNQKQNQNVLKSGNNFNQSYIIKDNNIKQIQNQEKPQVFNEKSSRQYILNSNREKKDFQKIVIQNKQNNIEIQNNSKNEKHDNKNLTDKNPNLEEKQKIYSNIKQKNQFLEVINQKPDKNLTPLLRKDSISEGSKYFNQSFQKIDVKGENKQQIDKREGGYLSNFGIKKQSSPVKTPSEQFLKQEYEEQSNIRKSVNRILEQKLSSNKINHTLSQNNLKIDVQSEEENDDKDSKNAKKNKDKKQIEKEQKEKKIYELNKKTTQMIQDFKERDSKSQIRSIKTELKNLMVLQGTKTNMSSITKIKQDCSKLETNLPNFQFMPDQEKDHRFLNAYVHAYKDMLRLKNVSDGKQKAGPDILQILKEPSDMSKKKDNEKEKSLDTFCRQVDFKQIDFQEYFKMVMASKGTGYDAESNARNFQNQLKSKKQQQIKSKTDTGIHDTMHARMEKAMQIKDGINDLEEQKDKFTIQKEQKETNKLIKECFKMAKLSKEAQESLKIVKIQKNTKENVQNKQVDPMNIITLMHKRTIEKRNQKQHEYSVQFTQVRDLHLQQRVYKRIKSNISRSQNSKHLVFSSNNIPQNNQNDLNQTTQNLQIQAVEPVIEKKRTFIDELQTNKNHQKTLKTLKLIEKKCNSICPRKKGLLLSLLERDTLEGQLAKKKYEAMKSGINNKVRALDRVQKEFNNHDKKVDFAIQNANLEYQILVKEKLELDKSLQNQKRKKNPKQLVKSATKESLFDDANGQQTNRKSIKTPHELNNDQIDYLD